MRVSDWSSDVCSSDLERLPALEAEGARLGDELGGILATIPNLPLADVPEGADENDNVEVALHGTPPTFDFAPREHDDIAPALGMDFETGVKLAGARFTLLRGPVARLYRALRSEEHTSELQSLMRISYAVFCWKKKHTQLTNHIALTTQHET